VTVIFALYSVQVGFILPLENGSSAELKPLTVALPYPDMEAPAEIHSGLSKRLPCLHCLRHIMA